MGLPRSTITQPLRLGLIALLVITLLAGAEGLTGQSEAVNDHLSSPKHFAKVLYQRQGGDLNQYRCLVTLWYMESRWKVHARNPWGGAYGIPQALPASKMAVIGTDWRYNYQTQIRWGLLYVRYHWNNSACNALRHERMYQWY